MGILRNFHGRFNYNRKKRLNGRTFTIPVINNLGLANLRISNNDWLYRLCSIMQMGMNECMVDVGVNIGQSLLVYRSTTDAPYWGFEPNPACIYYLDSLINANRFRQTRIVPVGLSSETVLARFYSKSRHDSAGTVVSDLRPGYYDEQTVSYVPLFTFAQAATGIPAVGFVKIDVEGAELEVIKGMAPMLAEQKPVVACEVLDAHSDSSIAAMQKRADELYAFVTGMGYQVFRIDARRNEFFREPVERITLKKWTQESFYLNDYIFVHPGNPRGL